MTQVCLCTNEAWNPAAPDDGVIVIATIGSTLASHFCAAPAAFAMHLRLLSAKNFGA